LELDYKIQISHLAADSKLLGTEKRIKRKIIYFYFMIARELISEKVFHLSSRARSFVKPLEMGVSCHSAQPCPAPMGIFSEVRFRKNPHNNVIVRPKCTIMLSLGFSEGF
jgi:hypothetical protein